VALSRGVLSLSFFLFAVVAGAGPVQVGLDRVDADGGAPLRGKRIGLVVHAASVAADGRHALEVLRSRGVTVVRLFAPEHGLDAQAEAGASVAADRGSSSRLPIVSLYGAKTQPSREDLAGLDALVFDLQDAGVRFYTYVSTMILCLEAAAEAGIELIVLDRPNPQGGELVEGPEADPEKLGKSLLSLAPGPLVHGLTVGEMARFVTSRSRTPPRLTVVPMEGWRRPMRWADTGRPWAPPSPNLRTAEAALAYPGTALLEATNVAEGRGTEAPFLLLGAPWIRPEEVISRVATAGFALEAAHFTPRRSQAALEPKYRDQECAGLRVSVTHPAAAHPYAFGLSLLQALRTRPGFQWLREGAALDTLLGTSRPRIALERGDSVEAIVRADAEAIAAFREARQSALLY
jgi:uncharacterized protein YbbC (DUF1343 family)